MRRLFSFLAKFEFFPELELIIHLLLRRQPNRHIAVDENRLLSLLKHHRLLLNVAEKQQAHFDLSDQFWEELHQLQQKQRWNMLLLTRDLLGIVSLLNSHNISFLLLKGPLLSHFLYQDYALRKSGDLDILLSPEDLPSTLQILFKNGFREVGNLRPLERSRGQMKKLFQYRGEITLYKTVERRVLKIDLHWSLFQPESLWKVDLKQLATEQHQLGDQKITTLGLEERFIYLAVHAVKHRAFRLFWIWDLHQYLKLHPELLDRPGFWEKIRTFGLERPVFSAFHILHMIFLYPLPQKVIVHRLNERTLNRITKQAYKSIFNPSPATRPPEIGYIRFRFSLRKDWSYKRDCVNMLLFSPADWDLVRLPVSFEFFYVFIRPFGFLIRRKLQLNTRKNHEGSI